MSLLDGIYEVDGERVNGQETAKGTRRRRRERGRTRENGRNERTSDSVDVEFV